MPRLTLLAALLLAVPALADELGAPPSLDGGPAALDRLAAPPSAWVAAFQSTYLWQRKPGFDAPYSGPKSLSPLAESSYTLTATAFLGARPWPGAELFVNPEVSQSELLSHLSGLAGLTNGEAQKSGGPTPTPYLARAFLRQTFALGDAGAPAEPGANQLGGAVPDHRLVVTVGRFAVVDVLDDNAYAHDPRTQFFNWTLMTYGAWDYAADARGYTWGLAVEYAVGPWAFRAGRFALPKESNGIDMDFDLLAHYGDNVEVVHAHELWGLPGKVRALGFRNVARQGAFADALRLAAARGGAPDFALVRRDQAKWGFGVGVEQAVSRDAGVFARYGANDGGTETYAFTEVERSFSAGLSVKGAAWRRRWDTFGLAFVQNELSDAHRAYVAAGGAGLFIGDGGLSYRPERIVEAYYSLQALRGLWLSVDAQRIANPAFNAARGPVNVIGLRVHAEL